MPQTPLHIATKKRPITKKSIMPVTAFDRIVLGASILYPFSAFPQAIAVFNGKTEGVSILSWCAFLVCAFLFLIYGLKRKVPPMIVSNSIWLVMDSLVIIGVLTAGSTITLL